MAKEEIQIKEIKKLIKEKFKITNKKQIEFIIDYIINDGKNIADSYEKVYGTTNRNTARVLGSRILKNVDISDILDVSGHGVDSMVEALDRLLETKPDKYVEMIIKLRKLDKVQLEVSGKLELPTISIVTQVE